MDTYFKAIKFALRVLDAPDTPQNRELFAALAVYNDKFKPKPQENNHV